MNEKAELKDIRQVVSGDPISEENATKAFQKLMDYYDVDPEDYRDQKIQYNAFKTIKRRLIRAIRQGNMEIKDEEGTPIIYQNLRKPPGDIGKQIRYKELDGNCRVALKDEAEDGNLRNQALAAIMIGEPVIVVRNFRSADLSLAEYIASFFMNA